MGLEKKVPYAVAMPDTMLYANFVLIERVTVKCNQTNKKFKVDVSSLSREDGEPLTEDDIAPEKQLLMEHNKKSWPVTVIKVEESISIGE